MIARLHNLMNDASASPRGVLWINSIDQTQVTETANVSSAVVVPFVRSVGCPRLSVRSTRLQFHLSTNVLQKTHFLHPVDVLNALCRAPIHDSICSEPTRFSIRAFVFHFQLS